MMLAHVIYPTCALIACVRVPADGRASSMLVYRDLQKRTDRVAVPLPFGDRGGLLLSAEHAQVDCLYGIDGATYLLNDPRAPGCSTSFCDPANLWSNNQLCGFSGAPATAWRPSDLKQLLTMHAQYGARWHAPGWHSGCQQTPGTRTSPHYTTSAPLPMPSLVALSLRKHGMPDSSLTVCVMIPDPALCGDSATKTMRWLSTASTTTTTCPTLWRHSSTSVGSRRAQI